MALHDVVQQLREQQHESELQHKHNHAERPSIDIPQVQDNPPEQTTPRLNQHDPSSKRLSAQFRSPPTTPSMRTGPPRSLSYSYSIPNSPVNSRNNSRMIEASEPIDILPEGVEQGGEYFAFSRRNTDFRGALEYSNSFDPRRPLRYGSHGFTSSFEASVALIPSSLAERPAACRPLRVTI
ncbi:hypothetical protein ONZ45_g19728 [Pleurotus djamor]|nr:hypothetical protein ONZ45_g19728 [Pleurotus djamor]